MIDKEDYVTPPTGIRITQKGVFDADKLWRKLRSYFNSKNYFFQEKGQTEKIKPVGRGIELEWIAEREVTDYIKFNIKIKFRLEKLNKVKTQRKEIYKGDFEMKTFAYLTLDYKKKWQAKPLSNLFFHIYNNYIIKGKIIELEDKLYEEVTEIQNIAKWVLDLHK